MTQLDLLSPLIPYPALSGGAAHILRVAQQLARFYRVHLCTLALDPAAIDWGPLAECCEELRAFPRTPRSKWGLAPPAVRLEYSAELVAHLQRVWAARPPEIVQLEFTSMAQYAPLARRAGALVVCTAVELTFLTQVRSPRHERSPLWRR